MAKRKVFPQEDMLPGMVPSLHDSVTPEGDGAPKFSLPTGSGAEGVDGIPETEKSEPVRKIGRKEVRAAAEILQKYKNGKKSLEARVIADEEWYKLQHWNLIHKPGVDNSPDSATAPTPDAMPTSGWLFSAIMNKHADAMDNYPEANVLPRERNDEQNAKTISAILPVILENNGFEGAYSLNWLEKLKHGTGIYGTFWDRSAENGLGDIKVTSLDILNVFWEPGITDIQDSRNLFICALRDNDLLEQEYPQLKGKLGGGLLDVAQYRHDDAIDTSEKSVVVDWYWKVMSPTGKVVVHFCKFVNDEPLYSSEDDPDYAERGFYDHGKYPVVFDVLFPEKGTPAGFGYVSVLHDPQLYIDRISGAVLQCAVMATKPRFWASSNCGVNVEDFKDWNKPIVDVDGVIDDTRIKQIKVEGIDGNTLNALQMKIDELKETAANRDFSSGGVTSGVTAASAISALQEAGNKVSRDIIGASYRCYADICYICIELMRQFYDLSREFRITGDNGSYQFISYNNETIKDQPLPLAYEGQERQFRRPVFDIRIKAQKKNPFSRASQNEMAIGLYKLGFFNPERAQESIVALELMEFEGKDKVLEAVRQGQTLLNVCKNMAMQLDSMAGIVQQLTGMPMDIDGAQGMQQQGSQQPNKPKQTGMGGRSVGAQQAVAQTPAAPMPQRYAAHSTPDMNTQGGKVM